MFESRIKYVRSYVIYVYSDFAHTNIKLTNDYNHEANQLPA